MITICPKCALTLAVTAADLRVAQGQVRCGRCLAVFNSLVSLYDDLPGHRGNPDSKAASATGEAEAARSAVEAERSSEAAQTAVADPESDIATRHDLQPVQATAEDPSRTDVHSAQLTDPGALTGANTDVFQHAAVAAVEPEPVPVPDAVDTVVATIIQESAANDSDVDEPQAANEPFIEQPPAATVEPATTETVVIAATITTAALPPAADAVSAAEVAANFAIAEAPPAAEAPSEAAAPPAAEAPPSAEATPSAEEAPAAAAPPPADAPQPLATSPASEAISAEADEPRTAVAERDSPHIGEVARDLDAAAELAATERRATHRRRLYAAGCFVMALLLAVQWLHFERARLAATASVGPRLQSIYRSLGAPIAPRWDVAAYEVRQQGAVGAAEANAPLTVRASILNRGRVAQPLPLLRVTLQDRYGNRLAMRDLEPREYVAIASPDSVLPPGQRIDAEVAIADPGGKAVGFEIDACLRVAPGRYSCANDPAQSAAATPPPAPATAAR